jgi:hypothetical protein
LSKQEINEFRKTVGGYNSEYARQASRLTL